MLVDKTEKQANTRTQGNKQLVTNVWNIFKCLSIAKQERTTGHGESG